MENNLVTQNRSQDPHTSDRDGHLRESRRLGYQLKYESPRASHSNISSKNVNDVSTFLPRSSELLKKHQDNVKDRQNEELVRYMSSLPSFLKKDVELNEKAFSVGVLDWKVLEKCQHFHNIGNQKSSASSGISSFSSTGGSSSNSSGTHSLSPSLHKLRYPTLQSHFYGTQFENGSHATKSLDVNKLNAQDRKAAPSGLPSVQQSTLSTHLSSDQKSEYRLRDCKVKDPKVVKSSMVRESKSHGDIREKMKIQDPESSRRHHKMGTTTDHYTIDEVHARKQVTHTYELGNKYPQTCRSMKLTDTKMLGSNKASHLSVPSANNSEASCTELACDMPHSCPPEADLSNPHLEKPCCSASQDNKNSNDVFWRSSDYRAVPVNNSKGKKLQGEKSIPAVKDQALINSVNPPMSSNTKPVSSVTPKVRNPSPTRRFSFSLTRVGKVSSSNATSTVLQSNARNPVGSSGAEEVCISSSSLNNSKANGKGRSSPLRRLLDPLMRPARASLSDSRSSEPASKSSGHCESTSHSVKVKLDLKTCKNGDAEVPHRSSKSPTVQALLQVAVRNGFPLFTFAVDNKTDILAATMRNSSSGKEEFSYMYSFFTVEEMKKKSGNWINHGRKDNGNSFVHNIVAQMKVTDACKQNSLDQSILREYVLFSYNAKQAEMPDLEQNEELAAVVIKISKKSSSWCQNCPGNENSDDSASPMLKQTHPLSSFKCNSRSGNKDDNRAEGQLSMTVLLPGGHHGHPIKGEPSSLVKRWKAGGSCDCGGWDLGCRMRVHNAQFHQTKLHHTPKLLELFSQDEGHDQKPVFSLAPFKDGIYAVEFNSSIEILQAFSISLSILSSLKPMEFVETSNGFKVKSPADVTVPGTGEEKKVCSRTQIGVPAFVSNPPLSPVGRV